MPWVLRIGWIATAVVGGTAIDSATEGRSHAMSTTSTWVGVSMWAFGVAAMAIPAALSLTATRVIVPLSLCAAVLAAAFGAGASDGAVFIAVAAITTLVAFSADIGRSFVQASAYGEEDRCPLRPPAAYAMISALSWLIWAASAALGILALADGRHVIGGVLVVLSAAGLIWSWPRWHRLSQRWFVVVPAGVVIHDNLVLAETMMLRRSEVATIGLAPADTTAIDFTGPAAGHALEIVTTEPVTALQGATRGSAGGVPVDVSACLVSPTRPGQALAGARKRRIG
jgi:hypothetical protein